MAVRDQEGQWQDTVVQVSRFTNHSGNKDRARLVSTQAVLPLVAAPSSSPAQCACRSRYSNSLSAGARARHLQGRKLMERALHIQAHPQGGSSAISCPSWDTPATEQRSHPHAMRTRGRREGARLRGSFGPQQYKVHRGMARKGVCTLTQREKFLLSYQGLITHPGTVSSLPDTRQLSGTGTGY